MQSPVPYEVSANIGHSWAAMRRAIPAQLATQYIYIYMQAYAGRVRNDIDHDQLKPAAWRADNYLDGDSDDDLDVIMRGGPLIFPKMPARNDDMARREHVDDYAVSPIKGIASIGVLVKEGTGAMLAANGQ